MHKEQRQLSTDVGTFAYITILIKINPWEENVCLNRILWKYIG